uniref:Putative secreted protein n=1 Tax=Amblyomma americanum TaxID=6943 RepID=A0A0C9SFG0_AMBAM
MRAVTFLALGLVLCTVGSTPMSSQPEIKKNEVYLKTRQAVRRKDDLHLLWLSNQLNRSVAHCLISKWLEITKHGSHRTFEINDKITAPTGQSSSLGTPGGNDQLKKNITILVELVPDSANLVIKADDGDLDPRWSEPHTVLNATKKCFVLRAVVTPQWKALCLVFGLKNGGQECFEMAKKECETGTEVNLTDCQQSDKKGKKKKEEKS